MVGTASKIITADEIAAQLSGAVHEHRLQPGWAACREADARGIVAVQDKPKCYMIKQLSSDRDQKTRQDFGPFQIDLSSA